MVQIVTSVKNTFVHAFVHADVDSADCLQVGRNARRRASSAPARMTLDTAENDNYNAHACRAHGVEEFPLPPHDDDDYVSMHSHPGPSLLDMDVEGMLGCRGLETDSDDVNVGMEIDNTLSEEMDYYSVAAPAYHGVAYGVQWPNDNYRESPAQNLTCLSAAPMTPHGPAQRQLFSTSPITPREEQGHFYMQSYSENTSARMLYNAVREETQVEEHEETQADEKRTTVMLMNIPLRYTSTRLMSTIDSEGFATLYDFIYVPMAAARTCKGYAFVNCVNPSVAQRFVSAFDGFSRWSTASKNTCNAVWATQHQGLSANIDRYRNSTVLGKSVPDEYKPRLFKNGAEMPFPQPNRKPSLPTQRVGQLPKTYR